MLCAPLVLVGAVHAAETLFVDMAQQAGIDFTHINGMTGNYWYPEMVGGGGALLDYDNDGDLDLFAVQSGRLGEGELIFPAAGVPLHDRLYRNDSQRLADGRIRLRFTDVTEQSGIRGTGYGMGATVGDIDNDGWADIYVTGYGSNALWRNNGDGTFSDITASSGTADDRWSTSAAFFDYDQDGLLDLYVVNYVEYSVERNPRCFATSTRIDYCGPAAFTPAGDSLFRNTGNNRFQRVESSVLRQARAGAGLGVVTADFNGDNKVDIFIANDGMENHLWLNRGGTFVEDGLMAGVAVNQEGRPEASMGVDAGDFDNDGDEDLFMTHLMGETNTLYINDGSGLFEDRTKELGLSLPSLRYTSFGTAWFDYDNDGWLDLLTLNGAVRVIDQLVLQNDPYPLHQPNQLFRNRQGKGFDEVTQPGAAFDLSEVSRGAAFGDIDNDGDTDVVVFNNQGPLRLLQNGIGSDASWIGFRLMLDEQGRDAYGARVELTLADGTKRRRRVRVDGSYCSANDPRVLIGLGRIDRVDGIEVVWPDGSREAFAAKPVRQYHLLVQGRGLPDK